MGNGHIYFKSKPKGMDTGVEPYLHVGIGSFSNDDWNGNEYVITSRLFQAFGMTMQGRRNVFCIGGANKASAGDANL